MKKRADTLCKPTQSLSSITLKGLDKIIEPIRGWVTAEEALKLYTISASVESKNCIVEVGACEGKSTVALGLGASSGNGAPIFTIEPHENFVGENGGRFGPKNRKAFMENMIATGCYKNVRLINLSSEVVSPNWLIPIGFLWIDGDHSYEGVRRDWDCWKKHIVNGGVIAFDDSTDDRLGPKKVIREILENKEAVFIELIGKVSFLKKLLN